MRNSIEMAVFERDGLLFALCRTLSNKPAILEQTMHDTVYSGTIETLSSKFYPMCCYGQVGTKENDGRFEIAPGISAPAATTGKKYRLLLQYASQAVHD